MAASGTMFEERRLGVLDGLRGIAVLLVLWYHVWEISWLPAPFTWLEFVPETGFVGVLLFFYLSGFVISYPFVRARDGHGKPPTWGRFAWRRFTKIVPSYVLSIAVAYAIGYAQIQPFASPAPDLLSHLLFVHTWFPQRFGTINGVLWTLAVEVEFYCIFPLVWWLFRRGPWPTAAGMILLAWAWRAWWAHCCYSTFFPSYEENLPGYLDVFAFGMISSHLFVRYGDRLRTTAWRYAGIAVAAAGVALLVLLLQRLFDFRAVDQWAGVWQINKRPLLGLGFALTALGFLVAPQWWQSLLVNPPLRFLAVISYNLYLYHQIVARELLRRHIPPFVGDPQYDPVWQVRFTVVAPTVAILQAALVTYLVERPLLRLPPPRLVRRSDGALRIAWTSSANAATRSPKPRSR
ncbi:MAG TPA: acyltransferase [Candidatus Acidoferrales bacterium]|nr:acyltransferase [Candidatus Acidoferrales bacterium]